MEFFKNWSFSVCTALIVSAVLSVFTPSDSTKRFYKTMIAVFIFISFVYPLKDFDADVFRNFGSVDIAKSVNSSYETGINSSITSFLKEKGIIGASVSSEVLYNEDDNTAEISAVTVFIPDEYSAEETKELIFSELGVNAEVIYLGQ